MALTRKNRWKKVAKGCLGDNPEGPLTPGAKRAVNELTPCFLTFHVLSSALQAKFNQAAAPRTDTALN